MPRHLQAIEDGAHLRNRQDGAEFGIERITEALVCRELTIPVIAGTNAKEGSVFLQGFPVTTQTEYRRYLNSYYAPCGAELFELYPATSAADVKASVDHIITDALFL